MAITLEQIKSLRDKTGVSITACKAALEEANGDEEKAIEIMRKRGEAKALSRADRETGEGVVCVSAEGSTKVAMISLNCETDFVAKSPEFIAAAQEIADKVLASGVDVDMASFVTDLGSRMGEKVELTKPVIVEGEVVASYVHTNLKVGVVVSISGGNPEVARDVAMHAAATRPSQMSPDEVSADAIAKEMLIWNDELSKSGKPEAIWGKILEGKEKKFREENALLTQPFVKNPDQSIAEFLQSNGATLVSFVTFSI
jgi:elongation factor Ts